MDARTHIKNPNCYMTLCKRSLFTNAPCPRWVNTRMPWVDCKTCLKVFARGGEWLASIEVSPTLRS